MLFAIFIDLQFLLFFLGCLLGLQLLVFFVDDVNVLPVLHVLRPLFLFFLLFLANMFLGLKSEQFSLFHFLFVLVDVLLNNLFMLLLQIFLKLFKFFLLILLLFPLFLLHRLDLVLTKIKNTMVSS